MQTHPLRSIFPAACLALIGAGCSSPPAAPTEQSAKPAGYRVYVTNETTGDLTIIDSTTMQGTSVHLGKRPRGIHASPDGKLIYVALSGSPIGGPGVDDSTLPPPDKSADGIGVFDVQQNKVVRVLEGGSDPENFAVSADGHTLYISNEDFSGVSFLDVASGKITKSISTGKEPEGVTLSADGKLVYSTAEADGTISVIDTAAQKLLKTFKVGHRPRSIVFMPDAVHGYVNAENDGTVIPFDAAKYQAGKPIELGKAGEIKPMGLALSPDSSKLYVSTGRGKKVFVIDTATNQITASFEVGTRPWGIALSPDGKTLFTANGPSNDVSVVDVATQAVTKKVAATGSPWGVLVLNR